MRSLLALLFLAAVCAAQVSTDQKREAAERALADKVMADVEVQTPRIADRSVENYVGSVARRLSPHCGPRTQVEVRVLVSGQLTAHAVLGSYLTVNTGLLAHMESEAELAGVVAHLLSYMRDHARPQKVDGASIPLVVWHPYSYGADAASVVPQGYLKTLAAQIIQADSAAVQCLAAAGYDPEPFLDNLRKLAEAESHGSAASPIAGHLPASQRVENVDQAIRRLPPRTEYVLSGQAFADARSRAEAATVQAVAKPKREPPTLRRDVRPSRVI